MAGNFDRAREDVGNIVALGHVNRNPGQTNVDYVRGRDAFPGSY